MSFCEILNTIPCRNWFNFSFGNKSPLPIRYTTRIKAFWWCWLYEWRMKINKRKIIFTREPAVLDWAFKYWIKAAKFNDWMCWIEFMNKHSIPYILCSELQIIFKLIYTATIWNYTQISCKDRFELENSTWFYFSFSVTFCSKYVHWKVKMSIMHAAIVTVWLLCIWTLKLLKLNVLLLHDWMPYSDIIERHPFLRTIRWPKNSWNSSSAL